jgi:orotidine-5'-phosphate decarboxylase
MNRQALIENIIDKQTMLCVGLDTDIRRIPQFLLNHYDDPIFEFNRRIIESTKDECVAYKFNIAFYESLGPKGWDSLQKSLELIPKDIFTIADAKRGDIGNTSQLYARTFFETYNFDSITVSPYMGSDSLEPFYGYDDKWIIILGLTSNTGSQDFQMQKLADGRELYKEIIRRSAEFGDENNTMFVVGATQSEYLKEIRKIVPNHFFLMPGIGKQGGDLQTSLEFGMNDEFGLLINSSRDIIYAGSEEDFDSEALKAAKTLNYSLRGFVNF